MTTCVGWCGACYAAQKGREFRPGHRHGNKRRRRRVGKMPYKVPRKGVSSNGSAKEGWTDEPFKAAYPSLHDWLGQGAGPDGVARETGTVLVFVEQGRIKACCTDRESNQRTFITATSWEGLLGALEEALATGEADWRVVKPFVKGR